MFTGIVEEIGCVRQIHKSPLGARLTIAARKVMEGSRLGDSIATNGVCLTVTDLSDQSFTADVMAQTMRLSSLGDLKVGDGVNLERAARLGDRLGGHLVTGHIDGCGRLMEKLAEDKAVWLKISLDGALAKYLILRGSIAVQGVSLTIAKLEADAFWVSIIPHTSQETILIRQPIGARLNLEGDTIAKYVERLLDVRNQDQGISARGIDLGFLGENGFL